MRYARLMPLAFVLLGRMAALSASEPLVNAGSLLSQALETAQRSPSRKGYGDWQRPLLFLRIGVTMRMAGPPDEAAEAFRLCQKANAAGQFPPVVSEIEVELCRNLALIGQAEHALAIARKMSFRNYQAAAFYVTARELFESGRGADALRVLNRAPLLVRAKGTKRPPNEDLWNCAMTKLVVRMREWRLAERFAAAMTQSFWKAAAQAEIAAGLARAGRKDAALRAAQQVGDAYLRLLAYARVAAAFADDDKAEVRGRAIKGLEETIDKVKPPLARDFALRFAVRRLVRAGCEQEASALASRINDVRLRVLACCEFVRPDSAAQAEADIAAGPKDDRELLWETLAMSAGKRGFSSLTLRAAGRIARPWPRARALCSAGQRLLNAGKQVDAIRVFDAAAARLSDIDSPGWRCRAALRLALAYADAGAGEKADQQLTAARSALAQASPREVQQSLRIRLVETLVALKRRRAAAALIRAGQDARPSDAARGRLTVLLARAGEIDAALAEAKRQRLRDRLGPRLLIYYVARAGRTAEAVKLARRLRGKERAEALTDIARAQLRPSPRPAEPRAVGVYLHGSWPSWFPRLERMDARWELLPFFEPYELDAAGLAARYRALGFPGTGGHFDHMTPVGVAHVRKYLFDGGGFLGICAGQFLATTAGYVACGTDYLRGQGPHQVQIRKDHPVSLLLPPVVIIPRRNGGMMRPFPGCEAVGWYDKVGHYAALAAEEYGRGRVVAFSPHPEGSGNFIPRDVLCVNALDWAMGGLP